MTVSCARYQALKSGTRHYLSNHAADRKAADASKMARDMLEGSRTLLRHGGNDAHIVLKVPEGVLGVSDNDLMFYLMIMASEFGLRVEKRVDATVIFTKVGTPDDAKVESSDVNAIAFPFTLSVHA